MSVPWQSARASRGLLLVRGEPARASGWVRRGLVACEVVPQGEWTALVPAEPASRAGAPYDDPVATLVGRPLPGRIRPALGFFVVGDRAVVSVRPRGWRATQRWLVWEPGEGRVRTPALEVARPTDLVAAAHARSGPGAVAAVVADRSGDATGWLRTLMATLGLPGSDLLTAGASPRGQVVAPTAQAVARFESRMAEQARHRAEMEES
ncbi:hypothetical protein [Pedococcus sp. 2YAF34]|uniref:hypothetical protein n=1 Tax=Pedococcus sp. 2YAF34 TaxID=3233032 RepID=UPI003F96A74A